MAELKESQKGVHAVSLPLKGLMVSLGNLTLFSGVVEGTGLVAVADATDAVAVEGLRVSSMLIRIE